MNKEIDEALNGAGVSGLSDLVSLIEFEIDQIHQTARSAGFNFWIITAGVSTCIWALISVYETKTVENEAAYRIVLFVLFLVMAILSLFGAGRLLIRQLESAKLRFMTPQSISIASGRVSIFSLSVGLLMAYLINRISGSSFLYTTLAYVEAAYFVLYAAIFILIPYLPIPLPEGDPFWVPKKMKFLVAAGRLLILFIPFAYLTIITALQLEKLSTPITLDDLKVSLLVMATIFLFLLLCKINIHASTLRQLKEIRRDLILGDLLVPIASNQVKIVLMGLSMADHLLPVHAKLLEHLQHYDREMAYAETEIYAFRRVIASKTDDSKLEVAVVGLISAITQHLSNAAGIMTEDVFQSYALLRGKLSDLATWYQVDSEVVQNARELWQDCKRRIAGYNLLVHGIFKEITETMGAKAAAHFIVQLNTIDGVNFDPQSGKVLCED